MRWRVIKTDDYRKSYAELDRSEETRFAVEKLRDRVTTDPTRQPPFSDLRMRCIKTTSYDGVSPVRLFYWIEGNTVYLALIQLYDEAD